MLPARSGRGSNKYYTKVTEDERKGISLSRNGSEKENKEIAPAPAPTRASDPTHDFPKLQAAKLQSAWLCPAFVAQDTGLGGLLAERVQSCCIMWRAVDGSALSTPTPSGRVSTHYWMRPGCHEGSNCWGHVAQPPWFKDAEDLDGCALV